MILHDAVYIPNGILSINLFTFHSLSEKELALLPLFSGAHYFRTSVPQNPFDSAHPLKMDKPERY
jgi:hypothetical protein